MPPAPCCDGRSATVFMCKVRHALECVVSFVGQETNPLSDGETVADARLRCL